MPYQSQRTLGIVDELGCLTDSLHIQRRTIHVAANEVHLLRLPVNLLNLCITREVEHHRARTATAGNIERTTDGPRNILRMAYLIRPLADRLCHTHEVNLLEGIGTQSTNSHLSGNHHYRRRVKHGIGHACQRIRGTRTTGHQGHTHLATDAGIALSGMDSTLLMTHQNVVETLLLASRIVEQRIVGRHNAAAGVAENGLYPFCLQRPHQRFRSCNSVSHIICFWLLAIGYWLNANSQLPTAIRLFLRRPYRHCSHSGRRHAKPC